MEPKTGWEMLFENEMLNNWMLIDRMTEGNTHQVIPPSRSCVWLCGEQNSDLGPNNSSRFWIRTVMRKMRLIFFFFPLAWIYALENVA